MFEEGFICEDYFEEEKEFEKFLKEEEYLRKKYLEEGKCKKSHVFAKKFRPCTQRRTLSCKNLIN